jgi:hypothetical protein
MIFSKPWRESPADEAFDKVLSMTVHRNRYDLRKPENFSSSIFILQLRKWSLKQ